MKVLYTGFKGKNNTSKIILDNLKTKDKVYLTNSFITSVKELYGRLDQEKYDLIVSIGQYPNLNNSIKLELSGEDTRENKKIYTTFNYDDLKKILLKCGYNAYISSKTNYLCNNIFYFGLKYIEEKGLSTKMILIHVPKIKLIDSPVKITKILEDYFDNIIL